KTDPPAALRPRPDQVPIARYGVGRGTSLDPRPEPALRRRGRARSRLVRHRRGADRRADWAEWRRQDQPVQLRQPALPALSWQHALRSPGAAAIATSPG